VYDCRVTQPAESYVTFEAYLEAEQKSQTKHEWLDGVVYDMAGGTIEHSRLATNIVNALARALPRCQVLGSDAMLYARATQLCTYADAVVVCGGMDIQKVERNGRWIGEALLNPTIVVEVLSESTEQYDRGEKFAHYMRIPSIEAYVLVSQDRPRIEVFRRPARGRWERDEAGDGGAIRLRDAILEVDEIYRRASS
jgi:Uma2 family endonuclease